MPKPFATLVLLAGLALVPAATGGTTVGAPKTIATASSIDYRAAIVARRASSGSAPTAVVTVQTFARAGVGWRQLGSLRLAGPYFWKTVTGPRAVCRLELDTGASGNASPHVLVRLLLTPSLGCGKTQTVSLATS
jgi:hypothetical protein